MSPQDSERNMNPGNTMSIQQLRQHHQQHTEQLIHQHSPQGMAQDEVIHLRQLGTAILSRKQAEQRTQMQMINGNMQRQMQGQAQGEQHHPTGPPLAPSLDHDFQTPGAPDQSIAVDTAAAPPGSQTETKTGPTITVLTIAFVEGVKTAFGEQSRETTAIFQVLTAFSRGKVTKRETISTILKALNGHDQLERDLIAVLEHPDSRWDRCDFDVLPLQKPVPHFIQPTHEPKIRLPSITLPWESGDRILPAAHFSLPNGPIHDISPVNDEVHFPSRAEQDRWHQPARSMISSPFLSQYENVSAFRRTSPGVDQRHDTQEWPVADQNANMDLSHWSLPGVSQDTSSSFSTWQDSYRDKMMGEGRNQLGTHDISLDNAQHVMSVGQIDSVSTASPSLLRRSGSVTAVSPRQLIPARRPGFILAPDPLYTYTERHDLAMLPLSEKHSHYATDHQSHVRGPYMSDEEIQRPEIHQEEFISDASPPKLASKQSRVDGSGIFIHALCGKGFTSRYKVRKHHWGNEMDNANTTTGCWNKHKKPDCRWDDHPSCKEQRKAPSSVRQKAGTVFRRQKELVYLEIQPKLQDNPQDLSTSRELHAAGQEYDKNTYPPKPYTNEDAKYTAYLPYHTHKLPASSSPFESLLTAVNFAAEIESPMPQRRNDSAMASKLNAHAIATEHAGEDQFARYQSQIAQDDKFHNFEDLPTHHAGTSHSVGNGSMAHSWRPTTTYPLHNTSYGSYAYSAGANQDAKYRYSHLNSWKAVVLSPTGTAVNEYRSAPSMAPGEDRSI